MMLQARGIQRSFGSQAVLRGIDLELAAGDRLAIRGSNGAGKSTLLRILAGTLEPSQGEVWISRHDLKKERAAAQHRIGWLPATDGGFFPRFTGLENLEFFAALRGLPPSATQESIVLCRPLPTLAKALDRPFHQCSSGMKQALAFARALIGKPDVLLLDEPMRSLDAESVRGMGEILSRLAQTAIVFSTHQEVDANFATREAVLTDGVLK